MAGTAVNGDEEYITQPLLHHHNLLRRPASNATSQVAIVGSNICPIESLDYEIIENDFFKQDWRSRGKIQICQYIFMKWITCFLIGFIVSLIAFCNNLAVENLTGMKFVVTSSMMLAQKLMSAFLMFAGSNFGLTSFACIIIAFIAPEATGSGIPEAAGSGIPEAEAYLNGVDAPAIFSLQSLVVKIIGSIAAVSSSLHVGKAGPTVHALQQ